MFDVLTIAAIADELADALLDGRVQRIGLTEPLGFAAEVYAGRRRRWLIASADNQNARLHLADTPPSLDPALITPFGLLLRKYVRGGIVVGVEQPPLERLIRLSIAKRLPLHNDRRARRDDPAEPDEPLALDPADEPEDDPEGEADATYVHLAIELMGRHSNLILVDDDGRVMESAKRVTPAMSRVRPVLPRLPYTPPPPIDKPDPRRLTAADAAALLAAEPPTADLAAVLVRRLRAVSPQMAREIAFRVGGGANATVGALAADAPADLARETRFLLEPLLTSAWSPRLYRERAADDDPGAPVAFAPVPMEHLSAAFAEETVPSISRAAEFAVGATAEGGPVRHAQRRERLLQAIRHARERQARRLASLQTERERAAAAERWREWGDLIYAYLWQIQPGDAELRVDGTTVLLDPALSAKENAQAYFERYRKAQSAGAHLPELETQVEAEIAYLDQLRLMVEQAEAFAEIEALTTEWEAHDGKTQERGKPARRPAERRPRPLLDAHGNAVLIGRSGAQNDLVTFDLAGPNDTWLHARGVPGSHVVVRWRHPSAEEEPATIAAAAALAAFYSAARTSASVEVDVTRRKNVRKIKGTGPGMVTYRHERTIAVHPADESAVKDVLAPSS